MCWRIHCVYSSYGVTPFSEVYDMVMGTFTRVTFELVPLNHLDEVRLQFKVFCTEIGFNDTWNGSLGERGRTQLPKDWLSLLAIRSSCRLNRLKRSKFSLRAVASISGSYCSRDRALLYIQRTQTQTGVG